MENTERSNYRSIPLKEQWEIFKGIIQFSMPYKKMFFWGILMGIVLTIVNTIMPRVIQIFIDDYLTSGLINTSVLVNFSLLYLFLTLFKMVMWYLNLYLFNLASEKTIQNMRDSLFTHIHKLGMRYFDQTSSGWLITRITNDTEALKDFWNVFLTILQGVFGLIASFIGMYLLNKSLALGIILFVPILLIIMRVYQQKSSKTYQSMKSKLSRLNTKLAEAINGIAIIQQFRQQKRLEEEFEDVNKQYFDDRFSMTKINALLLSPVINLLYTFSIIIILGIFGFNSFIGIVEVGVIYAFTTYANDFFKPLTRLMDSMSLFQDGIVSSSRILKILDTKEYTPGYVENTKDETIQIDKGKIEFKNVSFSYDGKNEILHNISFTVNPGETVALVGHTGSGKSSIINILMRFYEFQSGEVLIDGISIRNYPLTSLRKSIGLVLQDSFLFYGTIKDNIRLKNDKITDEEIVRAARFVQADSFIKDLPNQYNAKVVERGASYSSGQKQLISFASTIVRDPKILILDEATANIDTETETLIQEGLENMRKGRTTVAIAHRLSTIKDADTILVLDKGEIIERGNHAELIRLNGAYREMYEMQDISTEAH
ncbi:ABC transporter ATP-binding protein [Lacticigenium naphthae]|uniref:ABC transporter ATP-binding protein n=1 Tax=Lacticigenium naphthae TaxID=515351 RepID=UPI000426CEC6|nr:ABC transporter ATP-binding protein [Lacticigenium naphthae]